MQLAKRLPMEDSDFVQKLRAGYLGAQILSLAIYFYIQMVVSFDNLRFQSECHPLTKCDFHRFPFHRFSLRINADVAFPSTIADQEEERSHHLEIRSARLGHVPG
jgi:hypothetical protein